MPVDVARSSSPEMWRRIRPTASWASMPGMFSPGDSLVVRRDFYVDNKNVGRPIVP
ncbi:hypothetical protein D3C83_188370 [compost metagenome]